MSVTVATAAQIPPPPATTDAGGQFTVGGRAPGLQVRGAGFYRLFVRGEAVCLSAPDLPGVSQRLEVLSVTVSLAGVP